MNRKQLPVPSRQLPVTTSRSAGVLFPRHHGCSLILATCGGRGLVAGLWTRSGGDLRHISALEDGCTVFGIPEPDQESGPRCDFSSQVHAGTGRTVVLRGPRCSRWNETEAHCI